MTICKDCHAEGITTTRPATWPGPRCTTHHREFRARGQYLAHRNRVETQFSLGPGGYDRLLAAQGGKCAGCGKLPGPSAKRLAVDHDHTCCRGITSCGKCVRGLLCFDCNSVLSIYRDNAAKLRSLARYLEEWPSTRADI